jgi:small subunit ribosomal protein S1
LGLKQAQDNPWDEFERMYAVGTKTNGKVARILEKGIVVELPREVEGFVPNSQLKRLARGPKQPLNIGEEVPLEVIEFDKESKKIILAAQAPAGAEAEGEVDDETLKQYVVGSDMDTAPEGDVTPPAVDGENPEDQQA